MRIPIESNVSFADSEFVSYSRDTDALIIHLDLWNGKRVSIEFPGFEGMKDCGVGDVSNIVESSGESAFLLEILSRIFEIIPNDHPYRLFQFLDVDGDPVMNIVATSVVISDES